MFLVTGAHGGEIFVISSRIYQAETSVIWARVLKTLPNASDSPYLFVLPSPMFSAAFEHHIFSHLPCIRALFLSPSLSNISFARYVRPFVPPIFSGALRRTAFAPAAPAAPQEDTPQEDAPKLQPPVQPFSPSLLLPEHF